MKWEYKHVTITINSDGYFVFSVNGEKCRTESRRNAEKIIDEKTMGHFDFDDLQIMLRKLTPNEKKFVMEMALELSRHVNNAYCEMGITDSFPFDFDFDKLNEDF